MAKRRSGGTGSIFEIERKNRKTGELHKTGRWRALVTIDGKRISYHAKSQKEATEWVRKITDQVAQGLTFASTQKNLKLFLDQWLAMKESKLRISTIESYKRMARLYIKPNIGDVLLKDINTTLIENLYRTLREAKVGPRNIKLVHIILYGCLQHARKHGLVSQNWAELVESPKVEKKEMKVWSESQVSSFLVAYSEHRDEQGHVVREEHQDLTLYRLAFQTGMRRGELIGLQWQDVNWVKGTIRVQRQVYKPAGLPFRFQEPKTERGRRSIRLGVELIEALGKQYNKTLPLLREIAGDRWTEYDLVFPSSVGTPRNGWEVTKAFERLAERAGLPVIRFHDIRHTAASIMLMNGIPPVKVAARLGQSIAVLLDTYAHFIENDQDEESRLMDELTTTTSINAKDLVQGHRAHIARTFKTVQQELKEDRL